MNNDKELDQAAEASAISADPKDSVCDYRTAHEIGFKAGAHWQRAQAPKAPEEKTVDHLVRDLSHGLNTKVDAGILEEIISLFNAGVLKLYATQPRHEFNKDNLNLTVSQCIRVQFEGKEKIEALEKRVKELQDIIDNGMAEHAKDIERRDAANARAKELTDGISLAQGRLNETDNLLVEARTQAEALAGAILQYDVDELFSGNEELLNMLEPFRAAKGKE